jgi:hypothetical protein
MLISLNLTLREKQLLDYVMSDKSKRTGLICKRLGLRNKNYLNILNSLTQKTKDGDIWV